MSVATERATVSVEINGKKIELKEGMKTGDIAADRLRSLVDRIERLEEERKALSNDIADVYAKSKSAGFSKPALREVVRQRRKDPADVEEFETLVDIYKRALGM